MGIGWVGDLRSTAFGGFRKNRCLATVAKTWLRFDPSTSPTRQSRRSRVVGLRPPLLLEAVFAHHPCRLWAEASSVPVPGTAGQDPGCRPRSLRARHSTRQTVGHLVRLGQFSNPNSRASASIGATAPWEFRLVKLLVTHLEVTIESIPATEQLFLGTNPASQFHLSRIVNRILVPREVVGPRKFRPADFVGARIYAIADVRSMLSLLVLPPVSPPRRACRAMPLPFVCLKVLLRVEPQLTTVIRAAVRAGIIDGSSWHRRCFLV